MEPPRRGARRRDPAGGARRRSAGGARPRPGERVRPAARRVRAAGGGRAPDGVVVPGGPGRPLLDPGGAALRTDEAVRGRSAGLRPAASAARRGDDPRSPVRRGVPPGRGVPGRTAARRSGTAGSRRRAAPQGDGRRPRALAVPAGRRLRALLVAAGPGGGGALVSARRGPARRALVAPAAGRGHAGRGRRSGRRQGPVAAGARCRR